MTEQEEMDLLKKFVQWAYIQGAEHGFTLGKGRPPRPEDHARITQMTELTGQRLEDALRELKGTD